MGIIVSYRVGDGLLVFFWNSGVQCSPGPRTLGGGEEYRGGNGFYDIGHVDGGSPWLMQPPFQQFRSVLPWVSFRRTPGITECRPNGIGTMRVPVGVVLFQYKSKGVFVAETRQPFFQQRLIIGNLMEKTTR